MKAWRRSSRLVPAPSGSAPLPEGPSISISEHVPPPSVDGLWVWLDANPTVWSLEWHYESDPTWHPLVQIGGAARTATLFGGWSSPSHIQWRIRGETPSGTPVTEWSLSNILALGGD